MARVTFRFLEPKSLIGEIITWRLKERFSHAAIIIDDYAYSSTFPLVAMVPVSHFTVSSNHRRTRDIHLEVTDDQLQGIKAWCESQLCKPYDFLSLAGWLFTVHSWKSINATYCFEFCRRPLTFLGMLPAYDHLVSGHQLFRELSRLAGQAEDPHGEEYQNESADDVETSQAINDGQEFWYDVACGNFHCGDERHCEKDIQSK